MNFAIKNHKMRRRILRKRKTKMVEDNQALTDFAANSERGQDFDVAPGDKTHTALLNLRGFLRVAGKKLYVTQHHDRINVLHCGDAPKLR